MTTDNSLDRQLVEMLGESKPTLVEFFSPGCSRCRAMAPVFDELKTKYASRANIVQVDSTKSEDLLAKYHVHSHPYYILFKDGQECWRDGGVKPLSELEDMIDRFI